MSKNIGGCIMKWYKHDTDAFSDAKIRKLIMKYGAEGYAIYFHCIELIAGNISETNITFELEHDAEIIADNLKIRGSQDKSPIETVNEIMLYIIELGLFDESEGKIFCFKLLNRLDTSMTSSPKFRALISKAKESHDVVMTESCKTRLDKTRLDKNILDEPEIYSCTYFSINESKHNEYKELYPHIDILHQYKLMKLWLDDNPTKRKKNYGRFISNWLRNTEERRPKNTQKQQYERLR